MKDSDLKENEIVEKERNASSEYLDQILLNLLIGFAILEGPEFIYSKINKNLADINGLSIEDHLGRPIREVLPNAAEYILPRLQAVLERGKTTQSFEFSAVTPKEPNEERWFWDRFFPVYRDGEIHAVGVAVAEITGRKNAECKTKDIKNKMEHIISSNPAVIYSCRIENQQFIPKFVSPNLKEILGYAKEECLESSTWWTNHLHPEDRERILTDLSSLFEVDHHEHEYRFAHIDGTYRWIHDQLNLVRNEEGTPIEIIGSWLDITDRKQAESELTNYSIHLEDLVEERTAERMQLEKQLEIRQRADSLGDLALGIGHDFNNLLNGIKGFITLTSLSKDNLTQKQLEYLNKAELQCDTAASLIEQFQQLTREETLDSTSVDADLVSDQVFSLTKRLSERKIEQVICFELDQYYLHANQSQLHQVVMNLVVNSIQALESIEGEKFIRIKAEDYNAEVNNPHSLMVGEYVRMSIEDNGIGIPEELKSRVFDPYVTSKKRVDHRGQGLGLSIAYKIVTDSNGNIDLESEVGKGTKFHIYLPKAEKIIGETITIEEQVSHKTSGTILIVDDEESTREITSSYFTDKGYTVKTAVNGQQGLEVYTKEEIDVVLLDHEMPVMNGATALDKLLEVNPDANIVYMSGYDLERLPENVQTKTKEFLKKPFSLASLDQLLYKVSSQKT